MTSLSKYIDHTLLKPDNTADQIENLCSEAIQNNFASVCVSPNYVPLVHSLLKGSPVKVCTVIGFPLGYQTTTTKVKETQDAILKGAEEIDMVIAINQLKSGNWEYVSHDISEVYNLCKKEGKLLKVIIETALLHEEEKIKICNICAEIGVDFVKTSTGFSKSGATLADIQLMREILPANIEIKASGGIHDGAFARSLIKAGATRLGCSRSLNVINS